MKWFLPKPNESKRARLIMLDVFYVGVVIVFFALMWGFTKAVERL
jgi:hypothetical protein